MIGKTKQTINNYFSGRTKIDVETLEDIAKVLGVPVKYFFDEKESQKNINLNGTQNVVNNNGNSNSSADFEACKKELEAIKRESALKDKIIEILEGKK